MVLARIREIISKQGDALPRASLAIGAGTAKDSEGINQALLEADRRMYLDKAEFNRRTAVSCDSTPR